MQAKDSCTVGFAVVVLTDVLRKNICSRSVLKVPFGDLSNLGRSHTLINRSTRFAYSGEKLLIIEFGQMYVVK